jgi:hypothetical protein
MWDLTELQIMIFTLKMISATVLTQETTKVCSKFKLYKNTKQKIHFKQQITNCSLHTSTRWHVHNNTDTNLISHEEKTQYVKHEILLNNKIGEKNYVYIKK